MLKKTAGNRREVRKKRKGESSDVAATGSVRELNGLFRGRRRRPVSIEEMNAAIARGAQRGNT